MSYRINGKNLSAVKLMGRGKSADNRLKYMHVAPKGSTVLTPTLVARISLPEDIPNSTVAAIIPQKDIDALPRIPFGSEDSIPLPEGLPAVTQPEYLVPQIDKCFPSLEHQTASFTCNGELLQKMLAVACEVSKEKDKTLRLRIYRDYNMLRIDTYAEPDDQNFSGILKGIDYSGNYIAGEPVESKIEVPPVQRAIGLKVNVGRRFRGEGE